MNNLKLKTKHDLSHERIAMPLRRFFGVKTTESRKINEVKEDSEALNSLKFKYALHGRPFLCLNPQNNQFKKKT